jgi:two-component system, chemotaxis family, chemotaxis protein CheY
MGGNIIRRILLVEDDVGVREALHTLLTRFGYQVVMATNGVEAWEHLARGPRFAAILVDLLTPRMTGNDLVARVRRTPRLDEVPIIAMSGERGPDVPSAQAFLEKPFSREQLERALSRVGAAAGDRPEG